MSLTRLSNLISSTEGRFLYVDPNEFNASDLITNRGNSPTRPFKTIQRALLEVARFSYVAGPDRGNDKFDQYTVLLSPGDHWIDNRPGYFVNWDTTNNYWDTDQQLNGVDIIPQLTDQSNFDIFDDDNDLFKFNSVEGGVVIPRGTSLVGSDLRKTRVRPRYVPDPMYADYLDEDNNNQETTDYKLPGSYIEEAPNTTLPRAAFFRVTGGCYFWQFSIFDAVPTNTGGIFRYATNDPADNIKFSKYSQNYEWKTSKESLTNTDTTGLGSHHKLTGFAFANGMTVPDISLATNVASGDTSLTLNKINSGSQARIHMGDYLLIDNATNASKEIVRVKKVYTHLSKVDVYRSQLGTSAPVTHSINTTVTKLNDLGLFYAKVARGFSALTIEDPITDAQGEVEARQQENRIVGPLNVDNKIASIAISKVVGTKYKLSVTTRGSHGLFKGQIISLINLDSTQTSQSGGFGGDINGTVFVASVLNATTIECEKILAPNTVQQTYVFNNTAAATLIADIDTVDSASPYIFNCSIRSVFGICGMFCDGSKSTGFKSMVVAQYTGVSLQKDDRAFIKYMYQNLGNPDISQNVLMEPVFLKEGETGNEFPSDATPTKVSTLHSDGQAYYQDNWRTFHIHIRYEGLIQAVSVFAVGFCDHHLIEDGGDISITNSNSNFGNTALRAVGFREKAFPQDKTGRITHVIPPKELDPDDIKEFSWYPFDVKKTQAAVTSNRRKRMYLWEALKPTASPTYLFESKYIFGGKANEYVYAMERVGNKPTRLETYLATNTDSDGQYEHVQIKTFNVNPNTNICKLKTTGDSYRWYTGTPVRVSSEVGYLPDGMSPNTTYYIITENGSRWKDVNWTDGTGNISTVANEFKLAKTVEEARAGTSIDLRSQNPPTNADINNPNKCELKIYQYTSDVKPIPIQHEFKTESTTNEFICVNDASSANFTEIPHGFDAGQPVFFSKSENSDTLPQLSSGTLKTDQFYYVYPTSRSRFKITQDDTTTGGGRAAAIAGNSLITLGSVMASGGMKVYANAGQWTTDTEFAGANGTSWESRQPLQYDPTKLNNQFPDEDLQTYGNWCILTKHSHVTQAGTIQQAGNALINQILTDTQYTATSGGAKTTRLASLVRQKDNRPNYDRTYRFRYVLPKERRDARPPFLGYVVKLRTNDDGYVMDTWAGGASTDYTQYERTYYIYNIQEIQDFIPQVQDGVYYLTLLLADIGINHGTMIRGESGNLAQNWFKKHKFSQNVAELYPALDADNPIDNPDKATSCADHRIHGWVYSDLRTSSVTREGAEAFLTDNKYISSSIGSITVARKGFARRGREDQSRLFPIGYKPTNVNTRTTDVGIQVELRRPSLVRSGNHTFEYVGYGPGNYSTAFPSKQQRDLSDREVVVSQSKKEDAGVVFYSGLNSQGDLYVGTQKINAVTGQIEIIDESILEISSIPEEEKKAIEDEGENEDTDLPRVASFWNLTVMGTLTVENSNEDESPTRKFGSAGNNSLFYGGVEFQTPREADNSRQRISFYGSPNGYDPAAGGEYEGLHGLLSANNINLRSTVIQNINNEDNIKTIDSDEDNHSKDITLWGSTTRPTAYGTGDGQVIVNLYGADAGNITAKWSLGKHHGDIAYKPKGAFGGTGKHNHSWIYLPSGTGGTKGHWYQTGLTQTGAIYPFEDQTSSGNTGSLGINAYYRTASRRAELYVKGSAVSGANLKRDYYVGIDASDSVTPIFWMKKDGSGASAAKPSALFFTNAPSTEISQMKSIGTESYSFEVADGHTVKFADEVHMDDNVYIQDDLEFLGANSGIIVPGSHNSTSSYQNTSAECFFRYDSTTSSMSPAISASNPLGDMGSNPQKSNVYGNWSGSGKEFTSAAPTMFDAHIRDDIQNQALPVGAIIIWGGAYSNLPKGYCLCDGSTHKDRFGNTISVPDLRDKFVKGGSTTATGTMTGGYDSNTVKSKLSIYGHELSRPEVPAHSHGINHNYFRHVHGIQVQVGLNDLIGAAAGSDNPDAAFGTQWGSASHTKVTVAPDPLYDGQNSQSNTYPASNAGSFLDISGKGSMRSGPGTGGTVGGGGGSTSWNTIYGPGHTSQNYVQLSGTASGSWQTTYGPAINVSPVRTMNVKTTATSSTWSTAPNVSVDINWDLGGAGQIQQSGIHTTNLGWTTVASNIYDANNYMESTVSNAGVGGSGQAGWHFFYEGKLRAINPWSIQNNYTNQTWNYWGIYRFKGETQQTAGGTGSVTISFVHNPGNNTVNMVCGGSGTATITVDFSWLDNPSQNGTALGTYNIPSLGISCTQGSGTSGTISSQTATVTGGQTYTGTYTAGTNLGGIAAVAGATPGIEFWDGAGTDANATFTVSNISQNSSNDKYGITVERMTFAEWNYSSTKRYLVGPVNNIPSSATHTTSTQMSFINEIEEQTLTGGGGGGTYNFYYNGSNVGSNATGATITAGSLRYIMGSSVGNNQFQITVQQQQSSGGSGDGWHDFTAISSNPGRDDPRRTDTPTGSGKAGNTLGKQANNFEALHHHHPFQFSNDGSSAGVSHSTTGSSGYGQGINSYGSSLDEFSTLTFTLDNRPAYLELCYICKL